jgi:hypothetical protein
MSTETKPAPNVIFIDIESTALDRNTRQAWEIAYIVRTPGCGDVEESFFVEVNLANADPASLRFGRFFERSPQRNGDMVGQILDPGAAAFLVEEATRGAVLVGAVPSFDEETLDRLLRDHGLCPTWNYHLGDVEALAAGRLGVRPPWKLDQFLTAFGIVVPEGDRHTALGDARAARDLFDAVYANADEAMAVKA